MIGAMYEVQLVEDRRRKLFTGAREYRLARLARKRSRVDQAGRRALDQVA